MDLASQGVFLSTDPDTKGFDLSAGDRWIYPENYPIREYQYNIVSSSLYSNTLVCLPTGLGKTFIAAVVMYNFWRWYPQGKVVFLAPTKPLVAQQIHACHDIMGIPSIETIELTGSMNPKNRQIAWFKKRVIFATPQVFHNDLENHIAPGDLVRCVIIDEAHKALGKHSYCECLRILKTQNKCFRVIALSATPGGKIDDVHQVIKNLYISNLQLRDETSSDIVSYLNKRKMDIILVPLGDHLVKFKERYIHIMDRHVRRLTQFNVLKGETANISKGRIFHLQKEFQSKTERSGNYGQIMKTLNICLSMYHAYELMIRHGLRAFYGFYQNHSDKYWMNEEVQLQTLLDDVKSFLGPFPNVDPLPDGTIPEIPKDIQFGHTKFYKLKQLLLQHFKSFEAKKKDTRAIVFVEYRDSVNEVYVSLLQSRPLLRPQMFVGQAGQRQRQQMKAMEDFRTNKANILISTSVGEEGLDVGEVDLIVCFDMSQRSPIRLVQRMGRTGRQRDGRIIMLVTDGKEHQALKSTINRRDSLNNKVLQSSNIVSALYQDSPRMVPPECKPKCFKMHLNVQPKTPLKKGKKTINKMNEVSPSKENKKTTSKTKISKPAVESESYKPKGTQSSMLKFLIRTKSDNNVKEISHLDSQEIQEVPSTTTTQNRKPDTAKLLTSDNAAVEFLTLCAMRKSKMDALSNDLDKLDMTYFPSPPHDDVDNFFDVPPPSLDVLDCLSLLKDNEELLSPNTSENDGLDNMINDVFWDIDHNRFELADKAADDDCSAGAGELHFEDLLNDSHDSDETVFLGDEEDQNLNGGLEKSRFEDILSEESDISTHSSVNKNDNNDVLQNDDYINDLDKPGCFEDILDESSEDNIPECRQRSGSESDIFDDLLNELIDDKTSEQPQINEPGSVNFFEDLMNDSSDNSIGNGEPAFFNSEKQINQPSTSYAHSSSSEYRNENQFKFKSSSVVKQSVFQPSSDTKRSPLETLHRVAKSERDNPVKITEQLECHDTNDLHAASELNHLPISCKGNNDMISPFFASKRSQSSIPQSFFSPETSKCVKRKVPQIQDSFENNDDIFASNKKVRSDQTLLEINKHDNMKNKQVQESFHADDDDDIFMMDIEYPDPTGEDSRNDASMLSVTQMIDLVENSKPASRNSTNINMIHDNLSKSRALNTSISQPSTQKDADFAIQVENTSKQKSVAETSTFEYYGNKICNSEQSAEDDIFAIEDSPVANVDLIENQCHDDSRRDTNVNAKPKVGDKTLVTSIDITDIDWEDDVIEDAANRVCSEDDIFAIEDSPVANVDLIENQCHDDSRRDTNVNAKPKVGDKTLVTTIDLTDIDWEDDVIEDAANRVKDGRKYDNKGASIRVSANSNVENEKVLPMPSIEFNLEDFEWDSDFEIPSNPVASIKQFVNSSSIFENNKSSSNKKSEKFEKNSRLAKEENTGWISVSKSPSLLAKFSATTRKKLSLNKNTISKPSTSRKNSNSGSESEDDFITANNDNEKVGKFSSASISRENDNDSKTCYVLTSNSSLVTRNHGPRSLIGKENTHPESAIKSLSKFSAPNKYKCRAQLPSSPTGFSTGRKRTASLDGYSKKERESHRKKVRDRIRSEFIEGEAEVSSDTSEGSSGSDRDLEGFVSYTQVVHETVDMHAHYLQSVKSPYKRPGAFCFRELKPPTPDTEIFSQLDLAEDQSSYLHDSFCVVGDEDDDLEQSHNYSVLEQAENALKRRKRKRANGKFSDAIKKRKVVDRISASRSSSSEDETEKLRRQILEESILLKNGKD